MPQEEITPSSQTAFRDSARIPKAPINNGPLVYELTKKSSASGIDPNYYDQEGVVSTKTRETP